MTEYDAADNGRKCYDVAIAALRTQLLARQRIIAALKRSTYQPKQREANDQKA